MNQYIVSSSDCDKNINNKGKYCNCNCKCNCDCSCINNDLEVINVDNCESVTNIKIDKCKDVICINANDVYMNNLGRIIKVDVPIRNICPCRKFSVAVILVEVFNNCKEEIKGMKVIEIPKINARQCKDILLKSINFVVPEKNNDLCKERRFKIRIIANYNDINNSYCQELNYCY